MSDNYYKEQIYRTTAHLLDDSIININVVTLYKMDLTKFAQNEYHQLINDTIDNASNYSSNLQNLLRILSRFNDAEIIELNKKVVEGNFYNHYQIPLTFLAKNNIRPDKKLIDNFVKLPYYRYDLYDALKNGGKLEWYPINYLDQKFFAENDLYNFLDDDDEGTPESVKFIEKIPVKYNDKDQFIYVFKIIYMDIDGEEKVPVSYLAWAGPYSSDSSKPDLNPGELTGSNFDKWDDKEYKNMVLKEVNNIDQ